MKLLLLCCLAALSQCAPQRFNQQRQQGFDDRNQQFTDNQGRNSQLGNGQYIEILSQDQSPNEGGRFQHGFESDNGIIVSAQAEEGSAGQSNIQGSYSYTSPEGILVDVSYRCDEFGCIYESPNIPQEPSYVAELRRIAEEQRNQGITFQ